MSEFTIHTRVEVVAETRVSADTWEEALQRAKNLPLDSLVKPVGIAHFADEGPRRLEALLAEDE